jgi:hypothetical protein
MATRQTIYVGDRDEPLWKAAARLASRNRTSLSRVVADALADYLPRAAGEPAPADRWAHIAPAEATVMAA